MISYPGEFFFNAPFQGELFERGSYFFKVVFSLLTEQNSFHTGSILSFFRSKKETYSVHGELPGEVLEGGS